MIAAAAPQPGSESAPATIIAPGNQWVAKAEQFDSLWREAELLRWRAMRTIWKPDPTALSDAWRDTLHKLDRLQEEVADAIQRTLGDGQSLDVLLRRHADRARAYPMLTGRGVPDKLYDRVLADATAGTPPGDGAAAVIAATAAYETYARERDASERLLLGIMLRDSRRGPPIPMPRPEGESADPDLRAWTGALAQRMAAAKRCSDQLVALLPEASRTEALEAAGEMTQAEASSYFSAIPRH